MKNPVIRLIIFLLLVCAALYAEQLFTAIGIGPDDQIGREFGHAVLQSLAWLSGAFVITYGINVILWEGFAKKYGNRPVPALLRNVVAIIIIVLAITGIVGVVFGRDVTGIWATSGAIGLVIGFALRNMIQDVFTGIALNIDGSIKAGDWIELHHRDFTKVQYGKVLEIAWRTCTIQLENDNIVVIPNSLMGMMAVTNFAHADHCTRLETEIVLDFDVPTDRACRILLSGATAATIENGILESPAPHVLVGQATERGVIYRIRYWGQLSNHSPSILHDKVMKHLLQNMLVAGLTPSVPKEDVFHETKPKRLLDHEAAPDRAAVLARTDLFGKSLSSSELSQLANEATVLSIDINKYLVREGDPGDSLFVLVEGNLDVFVNSEKNGSPVQVGKVEAGEIFGEMSLLAREPRSASIIANTSAIIYEISNQTLETLLENRPEIAKDLSKIVAERRVKINMKTQVIANENVDQEKQLMADQLLKRMKSVFKVLIGTP